MLLMMIKEVDVVKETVIVIEVVEEAMMIK
jgi:hypothetical protein